jgi:aminopeptidase N
MRNSIFLILLLIASNVKGQLKQHPLCKGSFRNLPSLKTTVASPEEDHYDIHHVKLDIKVSNQSAAIQGMVKIDAKVTAPNLTVFVFELHDTLNIDSLKLNGLGLPVQSFTSNAPIQQNVVRKVFLPTPLPQNANFSAEIYYHSPDPYQPPPYFNSRGILNGGSATTKTTFTSCEPYYSNLWWPCKHSLRDKIDSADIWITVPDSLMAGSNGLLKNISVPSQGFKRYEWKTIYPIDHYLISIAVANYYDHSYFMHFTGGTDSMLLQNFLYANSPSPFLSQIDSVGYIIDYYSSLIGRYPFWKEKYGHCWAPMNGAMENQTMSTMGGPYFAHELAHQWFGDNVTCGTWSDIWLNEGWATYLDYLWQEHLNQMYYWNNVMGSGLNNTSVYQYDTAYAHPPSIAYDKAAFVLRMLRYKINNDSVFFNSAKAYQSIFSGRTATTSDFQTIYESATGKPLDTFFTQWIYKAGYPTYGIRYFQTATKTIVRLIQTTSLPSSVSCFVMPLEIKMRSLAGDTIVKVYNKTNNETYIFDWANPLNPVTPFIVDPNYFVIHKSIAPVKDSSLLSVIEIPETGIKIFPNPTNNTWLLKNIKPGSVLKLLDVSGRTIWSGVAVESTFSIPELQLKNGFYFLDVIYNNATSAHKLFYQ